MTPPPGSVATSPLTTQLSHITEDRAISDHFADARWTSDTDEASSVWSAASYWVRRKRAQAISELGA